METLASLKSFHWLIDGSYQVIECILIDSHPPEINRIRRVFIGMLTTIISRIIKVCEIPCNTSFEQDNTTPVYLT